MQLNIQALLVISLIAGLFSQKIVFDNNTMLSSCTTDARSTIDAYLVTGTIGSNITVALNQNWSSVVFITLVRSQIDDTVCQLFLGNNSCQPCPTYNYTKCECDYNTTTDQAHFTVSAPVHVNDSHAVMYAKWQNTNKTIIYPSKNYTFPQIYDVNAAQLELTVSGVTGDLPSGSCSFRLTLNKSNDLKLCCSNTATPCYPHISFNGSVVTNISDMCVDYSTSQLASDGVTVDLDLSYSMCNLTDSSNGSSCTSTQKSPEQESSPNNECKIICPAVIVPVAVVIIAGVAVAVCCYKVKKRSKGVSNHGTNGNGDEVHTSEHHTKDRHNTEHRNQAYDGRRSSPSEVTIDGVKTTTHDNVPQHNTAHEKDSNNPISGRTNDANASQSVPGNPRQLPPLKGTHTDGQLHPPAVSRPASVEITSAQQ